MKKRIVIKIGTTLLTKPKGLLDEKNILRITGEISKIANSGKEIVIVTSGAIGAGAGKLKISGNSIVDKQALASIGQSYLMHLYSEAFKKNKKIVSQILLTYDDLSNRRRYLNARNTILTLLKHKVIPIINENDTVAVDEIRFGDNDRLSALVASKIDADWLIILTDVDGLYDGDPKRMKGAKLIKVVDKISRNLKDRAGGPGSRSGTGGMASKLEAAEVASSSGVTTFIINGKKSGLLKRILNGENPGTKLLPGEVVYSGKKRWIAFDVKIEGKIMVDKGAKEALIKKGKSLLSSGIKDLEGNFKVGSAVSVVDEKGREFGRGLVFYSSLDIRKIKGNKSSKIKEILGYKDYDEIIHRDNLVIMK